MLVALCEPAALHVLWAIAGVGLLTAGLLVLERINRHRQRADQRNARRRGRRGGGQRFGRRARLYRPRRPESVRRLATDSLRRVTIREAKIGNDLAIRITQQGAHPSALATFTGRFRVESHREALGHDAFVGRFRVGLVKQGDRWLIVAVDRRDFKHNLEACH